ncbi:hypothetical protein [Paenibacillus whitsoniae]|uniref:Lipoprotein n=1 Tax=Paenibacillus whitsoniae TaxID=2496558 RepID=A0A430JFD8_9BACL|nr:hypothetical protein [Paenibacillus whitsoniae]RTE09736.1 hypothetical protein EJQ19_10850 [Paenibacillus whitsoniae]
MLIYRAGKFAVVGVLVMVLSACSLFGGKAKQDEEAAKQKEQQTKAQSTGDQSIINQELKKQYDMYHEILKYRLDQQANMAKQTEERYKKLKEQSSKSSNQSNDKSKDTSSSSSDDTTKKDSEDESYSDN